MKVGTIVRLKVTCLGNGPGVLGVCYSEDNALGRPSYGILFENGEYDGFSPDEIRTFLEEAGFCEEICSYQFSNVMKLSQDYARGIFNVALLKRGACQ
jgi:hypothetical protein